MCYKSKKIYAKKEKQQNETITWVMDELPLTYAIQLLHHSIIPLIQTPFDMATDLEPHNPPVEKILLCSGCQKMRIAKPSWNGGGQEKGEDMVQYECQLLWWKK